MSASASDDSQDRRRKMAVLGVSSILLVAMVAAVAVGVTNNESSSDGTAEESLGNGISASQRNVEMLCQPVDYQEKCKETLSVVAENTTDPKELIKAELRSTVEELKKHIHNSDLYEELAKDNMSRQAMDVCNEVMGYAVDSLTQSIDKIDQFEFTRVHQFAYDLKVWLSATITYQRTCLDAFDQTNTDAGLKMAKVLNSSIALSSIALDIVTGVSELAKSFSFNFRKLLWVEDGIPSWASDSQRQLLQDAATTMSTVAASVAPAHPVGAQTTMPVGQGVVAPTRLSGAHATNPRHNRMASTPPLVHQGVAPTASPLPGVHTTNPLHSGMAPPSPVHQGVAPTTSTIPLRNGMAPIPPLVHQGVARTPSLGIAPATSSMGHRVAPTPPAGAQTTRPVGQGVAQAPLARGQTTTPMGQGLTGPGGIKVDAVVAQDGSGQYKTLTDALKVVPIPNTKPFVIYVKAGIYHEYVTLGFGQDHITIIGDGPTKTRFSGNKNYRDGTTTYLTATFGVNAKYFTAKDVGFENTAGPTKDQAVAVRVTEDYAIFYNCHFDGYQDTLYAMTNRQFYRDCTITGTIDFVFGSAAAVFQNCKLVLRRALGNQQCVVLASGREKADQTGALVMQNCHFTADQEFRTSPTKIQSFLGRPWRPHARTVIMDSQFDNIFEPAGYQSWIGTLYHETCEFFEYNNKGRIADAVVSRVKWPGVKQISAGDAMQFYPQRFFELYRDSAIASITGAADKDQWILNSGVPYSPGHM